MSRTEALLVMKLHLQGHVERHLAHMITVIVTSLRTSLIEKVPCSLQTITLLIDLNLCSVDVDPNTVGADFTSYSSTCELYGDEFR